MPVLAHGSQPWTTQNMYLITVNGFEDIVSHLTVL